MTSWDWAAEPAAWGLAGMGGGAAARPDGGRTASKGEAQNNSEAEAVMNMTRRW